MICQKLSLINIRQDLISNLLLGLAIGVEDEVVVTSVVARGASEARHVVLAHIVHLFNDLTGLGLRDVPIGAWMRTLRWFG